MKTYMIGLDLGTTAVKAVLFDKNGKLVDKVSVEYKLYTPDAVIAELDPDEVVDSTFGAVKELVGRSGRAGDVEFISFSSAMHSVILLDEKGERLTNCITWADRRGQKYAEQLNRQDGMEIYKRTGTPIHPMNPFVKLLHFKDKARDIYARIGKVTGIKSYVMQKLTGVYEVDKSIASSTGMMNLNESDWDAEVLGMLKLSTEQLPELVDTLKIYNGIKTGAAKKLGIDKDTKIVIGASDGVLANLGMNAIENGDVAVSIGTSGAIRTVVDIPKTDDRMRTFCYYLTDDRYVIGGPVNNGGVVLRWVRDEFFDTDEKSEDEDSYETITQLASEVPAGSNGLIFHPYLSGERAPIWNSKAAGSFYGLTLSHGRNHMIRAAMEGVLFNLYSVFLTLRKHMEEAGTVKASGGFARSEMWKQMMADIYGEKVSVPKSYESSAFGACVLGLYALGEIGDLSAVKYFVGEDDTYYPTQDTYLKYQEVMSVYIEIGRMMEQFYDRIESLRD